MLEGSGCAAGGPEAQAAACQQGPVPGAMRPQTPLTCAPCARTSSAPPATTPAASAAAACCAACRAPPRAAPRAGLRCTGLCGLCFVHARSSSSPALPVRELPKAAWPPPTRREGRASASPAPRLFRLSSFRVRDPGLSVCRRGFLAAGAGASAAGGRQASWRLSCGAPQHPESWNRSRPYCLPAILSWPAQPTGSAAHLQQGPGQAPLPPPVPLLLPAAAAPLRHSPRHSQSRLQKCKGGPS